MSILVGKFMIVELWCFQKRHYDNTRTVKTINTSSSVIFRHLTRGSEMWFIQALRIVFHENVPEKVLEMSCSWFLVFLTDYLASNPMLGNMRSRSIAFQLHSLLKIFRLNK